MYMLNENVKKESPNLILSTHRHAEVSTENEG